MHNSTLANSLVLIFSTAIEDVREKGLTLRATYEYLSFQLERLQKEGGNKELLDILSTSIRERAYTRAKCLVQWEQVIKDVNIVFSETPLETPKPLKRILSALLASVMYLSSTTSPMVHAEGIPKDIAMTQNLGTSKFLREGLGRYECKKLGGTSGYPLVITKTSMAFYLSDNTLSYNYEAPNTLNPIVPFTAHDGAWWIRDIRAGTSLRYDYQLDILTLGLLNGDRWKVINYRCDKEV